jgi:predicted short-subunit dehydrogenase-like oxidoreductase (DUF2520 family)
MDIAIIGTGRAGTSFAIALEKVGHVVRQYSHDDVAALGDPDVVLLCVPDDAIGDVARAIRPGRFVVAHVAGSRNLDVLAPHQRLGSLHPLAVLSAGELGARRLHAATYCVNGDPLVVELAQSLEGRIITIPDEERTLYHATATVAANHLVALMGHVQRLSQAAGLRLEDFLDLSRQALDDVVEFGPAKALTGPASRGDMATIDAHLHAIPDEERGTYVALTNAAFELSERRTSTSS